MCKTDEKTRQYYYLAARQNVPQKLRKLALRKHIMSKLLTLEDKNETEYNSISFLYFNGYHLRKRQKIKAKNSCKNQSENKKSSNLFEITRFLRETGTRLGRAWLPNSRVLKGSAVPIEIFERSPFHGKDSNTLKAS